ncbi:hypothetical protein JTE90_006425 [Oedothorax gibbosus]|uniref:SEC14-like protein 2 n=1 Tax=Oedothorax gibbosus TaxID=931172 RepID=A0AAV6TZQ1_9ARAC|nr:hypothetical protein JTE90_006425 [Oedothorax gibbosus]
MPKLENLIPLPRKESLKWSGCNYLDMTSMNGKPDHEKQEQHKAVVLKEFRRIVQDILEPHHDDMFLTRFLKARDYDVIKADKMIRESFSFRKKIGADTILTEYEYPEVYAKHPVSAFLGFDRENSPVRLFMAGICDYKGFVYSMRVTGMMKLLTYFLEYDLSKVQEKKNNGSKLDMKSTFILDFQDFSLKKFYDKSVINAGIQLITMYQDNYPETLKKAYLVNVPSYFSWVFNIFKPFLNSVTLSKISVYKTDEWQEELRNAMDPKLLPAFLGGKLTDPDGNPKCTHLINWQAKIDASYYLTQRQTADQEDDPSMKTATVQQRGTLQVPVQVQVPGSLLRWTFMTKEYNIKFGLFLKEKSGKLKELVAVESVDCQVIPEESEFLCEKAGTYVLHFDNSYSWMTAKQLTYKVDVQSPDETNNN